MARPLIVEGQILESMSEKHVASR